MCFGRHAFGSCCCFRKHHFAETCLVSAVLEQLFLLLCFVLICVLFFVIIFLFLIFFFFVVLFSLRSKTQFAVAAEGAGTKLALKSKPLVYSFAFIDKWLIFDPDHDEEEVSSTLVSVGLELDGSVLCVEKRGGQALSKDQLEQCVKAAHKRK